MSAISECSFSAKPFNSYFSTDRDLCGSVVSLEFVHFFFHQLHHIGVVSCPLEQLPQDSLAEWLSDQIDM